LRRSFAKKAGMILKARGLALMNNLCRSLSGGSHAAKAIHPEKDFIFAVLWDMNVLMF